MIPTPFEQAAAILPQALQRYVFALDCRKKMLVEEFRLRVGQPFRVVIGANEHCPTAQAVMTSEDLHHVIEMASERSVHTVMDRLCSGFVTVKGGHRLAICGEAIMEHGKMIGFRRPSSLNLRIAREVRGAAEGILPQLMEGDMLQSTLIIAPPGFGKTTLLRDLIRRISAGEGIAAQRVGVVDERGELASLWNGAPQLDLGPQSDIMDGIPKAEGMVLMLRGMNPQVLAVDEITHPDDISAVAQSAGCGVTVLATIHGRDLKEILMRPVCRELIKQNIFRRAVLIGRTDEGKRTWKVEEIR